MRSIPFSVGLILGSLVMFLFFKNCQGPVTMTKEVPILSIKVDRDTTYITQFKTKTVTLRLAGVQQIVHSDSTILDTIWLNKQAKKRYAKYFVTNTIRDTVTMEKNLSLHYEANVTGTLNSMKLGYTDSRPTMVLNDSVTITSQLPRKATRGLYIGGIVNPTLTRIGPSLQYVNHKNSFGVSYNLLPEASVTGYAPQVSKLEFSYHRKLF